ncbi:hypothetical protein TRFO_21858 [Tritrichomonas foetus]|uniref:Glycosyltransferase 61 catalytic domain-containing protein n=1 Tax=Tritrichomonas foetus TaxID=1144522 RepID=A0A1J4KDM0_9EUKA|nr:hypothetical protein TRFO_21858 [Tritrichomonas foetus]|eukprot:OHT09291.1 hypothetical protein TRFO_21858 [Tritrichomonas foetus]
MRKKNIVLLILGLLIFVLISTSVSYTIISSLDPNLFLVPPFLNANGTYLIFELDENPDNLYFSIKAPGSGAFEKLNSYCEDKTCSIPMIIGGSVIFELNNKNKLIYSKQLTLPQLKMNCTDEPWTNRICTFHDVCYIDGMFIFESPYPLIFESELLCLGSKTPPVDLEYNRLIDKFKTVKSSYLNDFDAFHNFYMTVPRVNEPSNYVSVYYNMNMIWHQNFDYLLPLYQTLTMHSNLDYNRKIFLPDFVPEIPELTKALTKYNVMKLDKNLCFKEITMGMTKITNLSLDKNDPPYSFCSNCSTGLREAVLQYFNISENNIHDESDDGDIDAQDRNEIQGKENIHVEENKKCNIVFLGRKSKIRHILNEDEIIENLKKSFPDCEVQLQFFEAMPLKSQVEIISKANVFISIHGSGLANLLWLKHNSAVIEILPKDFTCRDWYQKAANASGVHYYSYYANSEGETVDGDLEGYKKCKSKRNKCNDKYCIDVLRDRNVRININQFLSEISEFLKSVKII